MSAPMMKCGHAANSVAQSGEPVCAICVGIRPGWDEIDYVPESKPDGNPLDGREAICSYKYGKLGVHGKVKSSSDLAFFQHLPDQEYDQYYCGCYGWD